jgi:exodeoxyribonuclease VII large subunit
MVFAQRLHFVAELLRRLRFVIRRQVDSLHTRLEQAQKSLALLSPLNVLERGYSLTFDVATGRLVRTAVELKSGQRLRTRLAIGEIESVVSPKSGSTPSDHAGGG